jgi:hypothetical protein
MPIEYLISSRNTEYLGQTSLLLLIGSYNANRKLIKTYNLILIASSLVFNTHYLIFLCLNLLFYKYWRIEPPNLPYANGYWLMGPPVR